MVVNFVHNPKASKLMVEELLKSINTLYSGLKVIVGVPETLPHSFSQYNNIRLLKFDKL